MMRTITPVLSILIAVLLFLFFIHPQYTDVKNLQAEIAEYKTATEKYKDFNQELQDKLSKKLNRSAYESERLDVLVPDTIDDSRLLVDLEAMAKKYSMLFGNITSDSGDAVLTQVSSDKQPQSDDLVTADISFELIGTYSQFKNFLRDLENSLTVMEVVGIKFEATEGQFQQFGVTVRAYALHK